MAFDIPIQIKDDGAPAKIRAIGGELAGVEGKASQASNAMGRFSREGSVAADKLKSSFSGFSGQLSQLSQQMLSIGAGFGGLTGGFKDMLGAIQGIGEGFASMALNAIRADEGLQRLQNRLGTISSSKYGASLLLGETSSLADRTYTDVTNTTDAFVRLKNATSELGFSESRVLNLTETISKSFQTSGKSSQEMSSAMLQLTQAFASGRLQGDEFRSINETMPSILEDIARSMHVTRGELKQLSSDGKIGASEMAKGFEDAAPRINKTFASMQTNWQQRMQPVLNEMTTNPNFTGDNFNNPYSVATNQGFGGAIGDLGLGKFIGGDAGVALDSLSTKAKAASGEVTGLGRTIAEATDYTKSLVAHFSDADKNTLSWTDSLRAMDEAFRKVHEQNEFGTFSPKAVAQVYAFDDAIQQLRGSVQGLSSAFAKDLWSGDSGIVGAMKMFGVDLTKPKPKRSGPAPKIIDALVGGTRNQMGRDELEAWATGESASESAGQAMNSDTWGTQGKLFNPEQVAIAERFISLLTTTVDKTAQWNNELRLLQQSMSPLEKGWDAMLHQATDVAGAMESAMTNAYRGMEDALVSFVTTGKVSWKSMVNSMLADLTRLLMRQGLASLVGMLGGGGTPSVFGTGATQAFSGLYGGAHAGGGDYTVPGSGPPDSRLVTFALTPGETASFTPPGESARSGGAKQPVYLTISGEQDEIELEDMVLKIVERNSGAIRSRLR